MMWRDTVDLLTVVITKDAYGADVESDPVPRNVFANKRSVRQSEFYQAAAVGIKPEVVFEIREAEYEGERQLQYSGIEYHIIRTYSKNGETLELICSRYPMEG